EEQAQHAEARRLADGLRQPRQLRARCSHDMASIKGFLHETAANPPRARPPSRRSLIRLLKFVGGDTIPVGGGSMSKHTGLLMLGLWLVASVAAADEAKKTKTMSDAQLTKLAMSAGPPDVTKDATIMVADEKMNMRQLKAGTNGWMCMAVQAGALDTMCL